MPSTVPVVIKSAWASKVNWIAGLTASAATINELVPLLPEPYKHYATIAVVVLGGIATIVTRTFYTTSVTASSVGGQS